MLGPGHFRFCLDEGFRFHKVHKNRRNRRTGVGGTIKKVLNQNIEGGDQGRVADADERVSEILTCK